MPTFALRLAPERGSDLAEITIGDFQEAFGLDLHEWTPQMYLDHWRSRIAQMIDGAPFVALMSWASSPPDDSHRRAWVLYREEDVVYVQERLFVIHDHEFELDHLGCVVSTYPRETRSDDGSPISEWRTSIAALKAFLAT